MKKFYFYGMVIVCLFCTATIHAQDRFWRLAAGTPGNWSSTANWSTTSGGAGGASVPNGAGFNAIFDNGATVNVDIDVTLNRLAVSGATLVRLIAAGTDPNIVVNSGTVGSEGLRIESGSTLEMNCPISTTFSLDFADNSRGVIAGTWDFTGAGGVNLPNGSTFTVPTTTGLANRLDINNGGIVRFGNNTRIPTPGPGGPAYIFFNSGSTYWLNRNGGASPPANWNANSTIRLTGIVDVAPVINVGSTPQIGNLVIDCAAFSPAAGSLELPLNNITVQGNLDVLNTNNEALSLLSGTSDPVTLTVNGNVNINGANAEVYIGEDIDKSYVLNVLGNFNLSAGSFLMQLSNGVGTHSTLLALRGNLNHTGGTFGCASTDASTTNELFVVEMNGTSAQTITSTGTIDNAQNMITLRINNAAGVSLSSPVAVGKVSWNSANKGIITTTATNFLTIRNADATAANVVNLPAANGYVSGPVRRLTNSTGVYRFPTGKGGVYRFSEVVPATTTASSYSSEYFNTAYSSLAVQNPLTGVSNVEYWQIARNSGSDASVQLTLNGAVPGASVSDGITVAQYLGIWTDMKGTTGTIVTPGTATTGTTRSMTLSTFSAPFTLAFGPASSLPVDLVSFNAKKISGSAALVTWTITASSTPDRFDVLRSTDGSNFSSIGTVQAAAQKLSYEFTDNNLPAGTTYYRLRLHDVNGQAKLSKVVVITGDNVNGLFLTSMAPTIVTSRARVNVASSEAGNLQLVITDMYGRIVKQQINGIAAGNQEIWMDMHTLPAGAYSVTGYLNGKRSSTIRFVKQ